MDTLYDLLGALPRDEAEDLRKAFRRAVKGTHPDLRPGDPDAAIKFRQIVRASEILADPEQRAAYDHLLTLAQIEKNRALVHPIAVKIHKVASGVMALASASIVTVGGYLVFMHMPISMALPAPSGHAASVRSLESNTDLTSRVSASIAAVSPAVMPDPAAVNALIAKSTAPVEPAPRPVITVANLDPLPPESEIAPEPVTVTLPQVVAGYVSPFRATRVAVSYSGDPNRPSADLDQVIQLDPKLLTSYAVRGIPFYPAVKSDHAFDDVTFGAGKPGHAREALALASKQSAEAEAPPKVVPLPLPRPRFPMRIFRRPAAWFASVFQ